MMRKAIAIDLDGTLCRRNTFNIFLRELLRSQAGRPSEFARLAGWMTARKLRIISHAEMKRHILSHAAAHDKALIGRATDIIVANANREVVALMKKCRADEYATILATAAPEVYASEVARRFGFDFCIATPTPVAGQKWEEARGTIKRDRILHVAADNSLALDIAVSDHSDDKPMLMAARQAILVEMPVGNLRRI